MKRSNKNRYGDMNAHAAGTIMRDIMRQAMEEIWRRRIDFVGVDKVVEYKPGKKDRVTEADFAAQAIFERKLVECFPDFGIVAEERNFLRKCRLPGGKTAELFFAVDPLDGTKAFDRKQSHGFGPMLALATPSEVIAAFVGDAMTKELFYYRPESEKVHRLNFGDYGHELLAIDQNRPLSEQYVLFRDNPSSFPSYISVTGQSRGHGGIFKDLEIAGGGIGTGFARLWKGEVGAYVLKGGPQTPWDLLPVWGISHKLGFVWLSRPEHANSWFRRTHRPTMEITSFDSPTIIIHESRVDEFLDMVVLCRRAKSFGPMKYVPSLRRLPP